MPETQFIAFLRMCRVVKKLCVQHYGGQMYVRVATHVQNVLWCISTRKLAWRRAWVCCAVYSMYFFSAKRVPGAPKQRHDGGTHPCKSAGSVIVPGSGEAAPLNGGVGSGRRPEPVLGGLPDAPLSRRNASSCALYSASSFSDFIMKSNTQKLRIIKATTRAIWCKRMMNGAANYILKPNTATVITSVMTKRYEQKNAIQHHSNQMFIAQERPNNSFWYIETGCIQSVKESSSTDVSWHCYGLWLSIHTDRYQKERSTCVWKYLLQHGFLFESLADIHFVGWISTQVLHNQWNTMVI